MATNAPDTSSPRPSWLQTITVGRRPRYTLIRILVVVTLCAVIFRVILLPIRVTGISMDPTYRDRSINFVNRLAYEFHEPRRGDVVSIRFAGDQVTYMKRIIGLPGEDVGFMRGRVLVNGALLSEPYEHSPCDWDVPSVKLGPDEYYVVGDNRTMPSQDHVFGIVSRARIIGRVLL